MAYSHESMMREFRNFFLSYLEGYFCYYFQILYRRNIVKTRNIIFLIIGKKETIWHQLWLESNVMIMAYVTLQLTLSFLFETLF